MTIEEMKQRKRELGYTNQTISERTGIPLSTVQKIFSGVTFSPREATIRALEGLLIKPSDPGTHQPSSRKPPSPMIIRDEQAAYDQHPSLHQYGQIGPYRLEDYHALPDEQRVELIDGYFYDMASPTGLHQAVCGFLCSRLLDFVTRNKGNCYPFIAPLDVQLDADDKTVVQPDVLVLCDRDKLRNGRIFGAPDLIIEVLSPSTRRKDLFLKLPKYHVAGVREYWMVDTKKRVIIQYDLQDEYAISIYGFDAEIPVLIWDGRCRINLREMTDSISFLLDRQ